MKKLKSVEVAYEKGYRVTGEGVVFSPFSNRVLSLMETTSGYHCFNCKVNGVSYPIPVHRLLAYQKFGDRIFEEGMQVRHLDGNWKNNKYSNIDTGTASQNQMDKCPLIRWWSAKLASEKLRKYDPEKVRKYYNENGNSYKKTMKEFNISSKGTLHYILKGKKWNHMKWTKKELYGREIGSTATLVQVAGLGGSSRHVHCGKSAKIHSGVFTPASVWAGDF